jgi:protein-S-isoprenylcysteine O-methyltransferase Ste14
MTLEQLETIIRWIGGLLAYTILGIIFYGIWRGTQRPAGLATGRSTRWLRSPWFYIVTSALFFSICYIGWIPLPQTFSPTGRALMLGLGSLVYFPGMSFVLWGRLALGKNYFVSTGFGAQLFAGHQLVSSGPFAVVRHPMYTGLFLAALGSLLIYPTWTTLLFASFAPMIIVRARNEEAALRAEFGEQWREYCQRVPAFFPRLW